MRITMEKASSLPTEWIEKNDQDESSGKRVSLKVHDEAVAAEKRQSKQCGSRSSESGPKLYEKFADEH
jgi:hypothetical protein